MSKQTEALKLALEALEFDGFTLEDATHRHYLVKAIAAIREALSEQPAQQRHISYVCPQCHWSLDEQPAQQQEPWGACVSGRVFVGRLPEHARKLSEDEGVPIQWLYTSPPAAHNIKENT